MLPQLYARGRRKLLVGLVSIGIVAGLCSLVIGWLIGQLAGGFSAWLALWVLVLVAGFFVAKFLERVLAEKLGQNYVAELRRGLIAHALRDERGPSAGITIARSTNDLSSIRNWIVQGLVPLIAGLPLLVVSGVGLFALHPLLAASLGLTLGLEAVFLFGLAGGTFASARTLRRHRGNLAARIADTVAARTAISAGGGVQREVARVQSSAQKVVDASVHRARYAAALRSSALAVPLLGTALVVSVCQMLGLPGSAVASALTLMGICAGSLGEWGKAVEYRQNYKAGRRIIAPLLAQEAQFSRAGTPPVSTRDAKEFMGQFSAVRIQFPVDDFGQFPVLRAQPGERIHIVGAERQRTRLLTAIATGSLGNLGASHYGVWVAEGRSEDLPATTRRKVIGAALETMVPERGTLARALRYRHPSASMEKALDLATRCGLDLEALPQREATRLRRGGEPLAPGQQAALLVARALLREPPVLVLDQILTRLPHAGYQYVVQRVNNYPGVVIFSGALPGIEATSLWCEAGLPANHQP